MDPVKDERGGYVLLLFSGVPCSWSLGMLWQIWHGGQALGFRSCRALIITSGRSGKSGQLQLGAVNLGALLEQLKAVNIRVKHLMYISKMGSSDSYQNRSRRRRTLKPERGPERAVSDRTILDDAKLMKIIHRSVQDLVTSRCAVNKAKIQSEHVVWPHGPEKPQSLFLQDF